MDSHLIAEKYGNSYLAQASDLLLYEMIGRA